jgi:hypothetical protein
VTALLVGLGNRDRGDDGVGPVVVGRVSVAGARVVEVVDPLDLLELWAGVDLVVVVDAVRGGRPAGEVVVLEAGAEPLPAPRDAILPTALGGEAPLLCLAIDVPQGEYRAGDQLWLRQHAPDEAAQLINRDVLAPRAGGRFAFGRLIDRKGSLVGLLPPGVGQRQIVIDNPAWLAVAEMLVRRL